MNGRLALRWLMLGLRPEKSASRIRDTAAIIRAQFVFLADDLMARSDAVKQADKRRREREELVECRAWVKRRHIEKLINAGTLTDAQGDDMMARGEAIAAAAEAWIENNVTG